MKQTIFKSKQQGHLAIQEDENGISLWQDLYYEYDFLEIDTEQPKTFKEAKTFLETQYGKLKMIETITSKRIK